MPLVRRKPITLAANIVIALSLLLGVPGSVLAQQAKQSYWYCYYGELWGAWSSNHPTFYRVSQVFEGPGIQGDWVKSAQPWSNAWMAFIVPLARTWRSSKGLSDESQMDVVSSCVESESRQEAVEYRTKLVEVGNRVYRFWQVPYVPIEFPVVLANAGPSVAKASTPPTPPQPQRAAVLTVDDSDARRKEAADREANAARARENAAREEIQRKGAAVNAQIKADYAAESRRVALSKAKWDADYKAHIAACAARGVSKANCPSRGSKQ